ncbi:CDP-diacylglycerol--glycerol-3-phosphate 3-phosphatidyltransferase [Rhodococcus marinonascens]|uniref:CDP-diacylglycerol--glycerol-3-phosphate 3-phosphatidyltransferase n=1 Tax=Rhodococcus marinonascens TaxID=38311 RepID=UPI0009331ECA|nr:CDP-diacylglycerol--glycerol-3-phosphate 3-phosphatidyltransferase [Rhodococcus marinonascens]
MSTQREDWAAADDAAASDQAAEPVGEATVPLLNIANILTILRIFLVPVFLVVLFVDDGHTTTWRLVATGVFVVAAITDRIDGQLARKYGLVTDFGKLADPIADKALIGAALVGLSILGDLPWWVTAVIAVRELGITLLRFAVLRHAVIPAGHGGKLKTLVQSVAIGFYLLPLPDGFEIVGWILMGAAVLLTVVTGLDYVVQAVRLRAGVHKVEANASTGA